MKAELKQLREKFLQEILKGNYEFEFIEQRNDWSECNVSIEGVQFNLSLSSEHKSICEHEVPIFLFKEVENRRYYNELYKNVETYKKDHIKKQIQKLQKQL